MKFYFCIAIGLLLNSCQRQISEPRDNNLDELYFPSVTNWETKNKSDLGISEKELVELRLFLEQNKTRAFLLLKDGKIVVEEYFGKDLNGSTDFSQSSSWYWASAGKSLTAFTIGLAQEKGFLNINDKTSDYLGKSWTSLSADKEMLITVKNQLSMTTGLEIKVPDSHCYEPNCLEYKIDAGERWEYHNGPYTLLHTVLTKATNTVSDKFMKNEVLNKIDMDGFWLDINNDHVFFSTPRSLAKFGLLILGKGDWDGKAIMEDKTYFDEMINTSQNLNEAYGYLWWLNGKSTGMVPSIQHVFNTALTPAAPDDMYSALGKNGQILSIVPSRNLVMIRMGEAPGDQIGLDFQNNLLEKILLLRV